MPVPERDIDFVGAGWSYPLGTDATGGVALVTRDREIEQAIRIHDHVFNAASSATVGQIAYDVRQALDRWEPRIEILDVGVSFDAMTIGVLYIDINYSIRSLNDPRNLVFPFYVIPSTADAIEPTALPGGA